MGTTAAYYCIWNRGFTQDVLKEKLKGISGSGKKEDDEFFQTLCRMCSPEVARQIWDDAEKARADFHAALWGKDQTQRDCATIAYRPDAKWLPLFETKLCEGYIASSRDAARLSKLFAVPVLAFSVFDSDILFVFGVPDVLCRSCEQEARCLRHVEETAGFRQRSGAVGL